jgi:hypothetical protein
MRKWECGLRPVGAIGAYAPEGIRNVEGGLRPVGAIGAYAPEGSGNEIAESGSRGDMA